MDNILQVKNLKKDYGDFVLNNVSFDVPKGAIVGLIGENGAGKSTTINAILGLIEKDNGTITLFDKQELEKVDKEQIGVVFDGNNFPESLSPVKLNSVLKRIYSHWNEEKFFSIIDKLSLPKNKKIKEFSRGMKMKLSIAAAFSHNSKLLILDEATSGLDPIVRDDILDMFLGFVQEEENAILVSSHITSDLEKVADYIVFIHNGEIIFNKPKDELMYKYGIIKCGAAQFEVIDKQDIIVYQKKDYEWDILIADRDLAHKKYPKAIIDPANIDDIMLLYVKGEKICED